MAELTGVPMRKRLLALLLPCSLPALVPPANILQENPQ
jgi:hypothetical protein